MTERLSAAAATPNPHVPEQHSCLAAGCQKPAHARGMCAPHYGVWHRTFRNKHRIVCAGCGVQVFVRARSNRGRRFCSAKCYRASMVEQYGGPSEKPYKQRRQAAHVEPVNRARVFERDKWRCHICRKRIRRGLRYPHPMSASVDHLVPLRSGGLHEMANAAAAHLICNLRKRDRGGGEQLLLIG